MDVIGQIGLMVYAAAAWAAVCMVRFVHASRPLRLDEVWGIFIFAGLLPYVSALMWQMLGLSDVLHDPSLRTFLLLQLPMVLFHPAFWCVVFAREGRRPRTLLVLFDRPRSRKPRFALGMLLMLLMIAAAVLLYWVTAGFTLSRPDCVSSKCRSAALFLGPRGTILPPLFFFGVYMSLFAGMMCAAMARRFFVPSSAD